MDMTVQEAIKELSTITCDEIKLGGTSFHQIPQPRDLGATLIRLANVSLPVEQNNGVKQNNGVMDKTTGSCLEN